MNQLFVKRYGGVMLLLCGLLWLARPASAATITVDGINCTLGNAITAANTDTATGGCLAGSGVDVIELAGDVTLTAALPVIDSDITLEGNGHTVARDSGASAFRIFYLINNVAFSINDMTITGGSALSNLGGGGIYNEAGTVTLTNSTVTGNLSDSNIGGTGGGIYNHTGQIILINSTIYSNTATRDGGGIHNAQGTLTLTRSTVSHNSGRNGAGIRNGINTLTITDSTISDNVATANGGGIYNNSGTATISNSTISGNTAVRGGGVYNLEGNITLTNATISRNLTSSFGGGIFNQSGRYILSHTIISGNDGTEIGVGNISSPEIYGNDYNIIGYDGSIRSAIPYTPGSDVVPSGGLETVLDTTLADNGGRTLTHALVRDSPAIDIVPTGSSGATDQRGAARDFAESGSPSTNQGDAGAVEFGERITVGVCDSTIVLEGEYQFNFTSGNRLSVDVITAGKLDCITIDEIGGDHPFATSWTSGAGIDTGMWWHISGNVDSDFVVDLTLPYSAADSGTRVCRHIGGGSGMVWDCDDGSQTSHTSTHVTRTGISGFSDWAVGQDVGPTAVTNLHASVSTTSDGHGKGLLPFAVCFLLLTAVWVQVLRRDRPMPHLS